MPYGFSIFQSPKDFALRKGFVSAVYIKRTGTLLVHTLAIRNEEIWQSEWMCGPPAGGFQALSYHLHMPWVLQLCAVSKEPVHSNLTNDWSSA